MGISTIFPCYESIAWQDSRPSLIASMKGIEIWLRMKPLIEARH
jgi:hypothetical protein